MLNDVRSLAGAPRRWSRSRCRPTPASPRGAEPGYRPTSAHIPGV